MGLIKRVLPLLLLLLAAAALAATQMMSVQVRTGQLRDKPSFLGKVQSSVAYGDRLKVMEVQGGWSLVQGEKTSGWIHSSALTPKKVVLQAGDVDVNTGASGEELALAGKGFNDEVEAEFKTSNPDVDFAWVNRMEKVKISAEQAARFLQAGGVTPGGGAK